MSQTPPYPPSGPPPGWGPSGQPPAPPPPPPPPGSPYGMPGHGVYVPPPSDAGSKRSLWIVLAAAAGVGAVVLGMVLLTGDDGPSPETTVRTFWEATDCATVVDHITEDSWRYVATEAQAESGSEPDSREEAIEACESGDRVAAGDRLESVELVSEDDDRAVVEVTADEDGDTATYDIPLRREDGQWKVDLVDFFVGPADEP